MIHPAAWLAWLIGVGAVVLVLDDPFAVAIAWAAGLVVATRTAQPGPEGRTWIMLAKLGALFLVLRIVLFAATGHTGPTRLFALPSARLPAWLGGFEVGGTVTGEVVAQAAFEGMKVAALLLAFGVVLSAIPTHRLLRALPRFLFEAGLVVGIAIAFVPTIARTARDVREAQRLRGHRARGLRSLVAPVLEATLERSMTLAAALETRGFGRSAERPSAGARAAVVVGVAAIAAGGALALFGRASGSALLAIGVLAVALGLHRLGAGTVRTRHQPEHLGAWDAALIVAGVLVTAGALLARAAGTEAWYAYPALGWPRVEVASVVLALGIIAPVAMLAARRARLRAASLEPVAATR